MALFAIISSPFINLWLAITHGCIVQHCFAFFPSASPLTFHYFFGCKFLLSDCFSATLIKNVKSTSAIVCWYGWSRLEKIAYFQYKRRVHVFVNLWPWSMAAMLRDSTTVAVVVVVRTRPRAMPLAMIHMRKSIHGFPFVPFYGYGAPLGGLGPPELRYYLSYREERKRQKLLGENGRPMST